MHHHPRQHTPIPTMSSHPDMIAHPYQHQYYQQQQQQQQQQYSRSHSRSNSGVYPQHGHHYPAPPHHDMMMPPPGFQGQGPSPIPQLENTMSHSRHSRSYSNSQPMPAYHDNNNEEDPHVWSGQPPSVPQLEHHLHQRPVHHPHPYSRPHSHSRSQSHSQQQFAHLVPPPPLPQHHSVQSTPPPRHASPVVTVARPRHAQEFYPEHADPVRFPAAAPAFVPSSAPAPASAPAPQHPAQTMQMAEEDDDQEGEVHERANSQLSTAAGDDGTDVSKCPDCDKVYKHGTSLWKHRWEHSVYWKSATKFMLSKHQQVQMMEAAAILLGMDESRETDQDPVVGVMMRQRGQSATFTSISSVSPFTFTKSLSVSPPPMAERAQAMKQESGAVMSPPTYYGRASNTTRHSVVSMTSTASSTPPSLAPDDESVAEVEEEVIMTGHSFRSAQHHHHHHHPQQQHPYAQPPMMEMSQKHPEPEFYAHDPRYPPYHHHHHPQPPVAHPSHYAPYYHSQH